MRAGVAGDEVEQRRRTESVKARGRPTGTATPRASRRRPGVLGRAGPLLAGDGDVEGPPLGDELIDPVLDGCALDGAQTELVERQRTEQPQQVVHLVGVAGAPAVDQALQLELEVGQDVGVDELAQLLGAEQVAQQVAVERERRGPPLGERGVALVHVDGDPAEQQRLGERRRALAVDRDEADLAAAQVAQHLGAAPAGRTRR